MVMYSSNSVVLKKYIAHFNAVQRISPSPRPVTLIYFMNNFKCVFPTLYLIPLIFTLYLSIFIT